MVDDEILRLQMFVKNDCQRGSIGGISKYHQPSCLMAGGAIKPYAETTQLRSFALEDYDIFFIPQQYTVIAS